MPTKTVTRAEYQRSLSEESWQQEVMDYAHVTGWLCAHFRPALTKDGRWVTAMSGDVGFPDCVFARNGVVVLAELKRWGLKPSEAQLRWIRESGGRWWTPEHRHEMHEVLK